MSSFRKSIKLENHSLTVFIFLNRLLRYRHCAKHFLKLEESWHALENVTVLAHDILTWRKNISQLKCAAEYHSEDDCLNFIQCNNFLAEYSLVYCDKIGDVLQETAESGAVVVCSDGTRHVFLSSEGVVVISRMLRKKDKKKWNVLTSYIPYERRIKTVTAQTVYERFFTALDNVLRKIEKHRPYCFVNKELWEKYKSMALKYAEAPDEYL